MPDQLIPTIPALLDAIDRLPRTTRGDRIAELERALTLTTTQREVAMGLLALDLATMDVT